MRRIVGLALALAFVGGLLFPNNAIAQEGTPTAATGGAVGPAVGASVPYIGQDGAQIGTLTVNTITEPFEDYDASTPPQRGYHFALVELTVANTGARPFEVNPGSVQMIDTEGFVATQTFASRGDAPAVPDLEYTDALAPGTEVSGAIVYEVFGASSIQRGLYIPTFDRMITLVDLRISLATAGTPVSIIGSSGQEVAQVTVNGVADPFQGFDEFSAPARGSRFVLVDVTVENTGGQLLSVSPSDIWVTDSDGFVLQSAFVTRLDVTTLPDFTFLDLQPGESQRGAIVYQVLEGIPSTQISYGDGFVRQIVIADLSAGVPAVTAVVASPTAATVITSIPDCEGLVEWGLEVSERIAAAEALISSLQGVDTETIDPQTLRDAAAQLRDFGDEQRNSNPPAAAEELNTLLADQYYAPLADAVDQIADASETNNKAGALAAQLAAARTAEYIRSDEVLAVGAQLEAVCPAEIQQLDEASQ